MWVAWWISFIIVTVVMIGCILHLQGKYSEKPIAFKIAVPTSISLFVALLIGSVVLSTYQPPWEGMGDVVSKEHIPQHTKKGVKVHYTVPECYAAYITPTDETYRKVKFTMVCLDKESWDEIKVGQLITVDRIGKKNILVK